MTTDQQERIDRANAMSRRKNREAGIPDMELGDRHEPVDYFAQVGFFWLLDQIGGPSDPDYDWSEELDSDVRCRKAREDYLAARKVDHQRIADWFRAAKVTPHQFGDGCKIGNVHINWPERIPATKTWSGNQTLAKIVLARIEELPARVSDIMVTEAALTGPSGLDRRTAVTALEAGFSTAKTKTKIVTAIGKELLGILGLESLPITVYPDRSLEYVASGVRYRFRREERGDYYGRWSQAEKQQ